MRTLLPGLIFVPFLVTACGGGDQAPGTADGGPGGAADAAIDPTWLATPQGADHLAADASYLYFTSSRGVERVPLGGGEAEVVVPVTLASTTDAFDALVALEVGEQTLVFVVAHQNLVDLNDYSKTLYVAPKAGGTPRMLDTSNDSRAYLGVTFDGDELYFSSFDSLLRVPLAGGPVEYVGESDSSIHYWVLTPIVIGDDVTWAEESTLYRMRKDDLGGRAEPLATLPGSGRLLWDGATLVVPVGEYLAEEVGTAVEVDPTTGAVSAPIDLGGSALDLVVAGRDLWVAGADGLRVVSRDDHAVVVAAPVVAYSLAAAGAVVFAATGTAIARVAR